MYVPHKYDWLAPVGVIAASFATYQKYASWDTALLVNVPAVFISCCWSVYLWQAGVVYQNWEAGKQPKTDAEYAEEARKRAERLGLGYLHTDGNTNVAVPLALKPTEQEPKVAPFWMRMLKPEKTEKRQIHPAMEAYQYTSTAPALPWDYVLKCDIKEICKRQKTYHKHPELGRPDGDYREEVWVKSGQMSRERLKKSLSVLEYANGIARAGARKNAPYTTIDWTVIELGARGEALPYPPELR